MLYRKSQFLAEHLTCSVCSSQESRIIVNSLNNPEYVVTSTRLNFRTAIILPGIGILIVFIGLTLIKQQKSLRKRQLFLVFSY